MMFIFKLTKLTPDSGHSVAALLIILHFPDGKLYSRIKKQQAYTITLF
jgi:hypothetical protein